MPAKLLAGLLGLASTSFFAAAGSCYLIGSLVLRARTLHPRVRLSCRVILLLAGQRLRIQGTFPPAPREPCIYLHNHAPMLDTFVLIAVIPEFVGAGGKRA